jgi:hypothetical protein
VSLRHGGEVGLQIIHRLVASRLHPTPHGPRADGATAVLTQQPGGGGKWDKDRQGTAQGLQLTAGPLMWLHSQGLIERRDLWDGTTLGTAANPTAPPERSKQARHLARGKALTTQRSPAPGAGGPGEWPTRSFGQHGFDEVDGEHTGHLPRRQDQGGEGLSVFDCVQQTLHRWISEVYAVVKA